MIWVDHILWSCSHPPCSSETILQAPPGQMPIHLTSLGQDLDLGQGCCPLHGLENVYILLLGREHLCILLLGQVHMCILPLVLGHVYILLLVPRHVYIILQVLGHVKCLLRHLLYQLGSWTYLPPPGSSWTLGAQPSSHKDPVTGAEARPKSAGTLPPIHREPSRPTAVSLTPMLIADSSTG